VEAEAERAALERRLAEQAQEMSDFKRESERRLAAADDLLALTRRRLSGAEAEVQKLQQEIEEQDAALADSVRREAATAARLTVLDAARQEAEAALRGARTERDALQREAETARAMRDQVQARVADVELGDAALRREIARLGRALVAAPDPGAAPARAELVQGGPRPADPLPVRSPSLEQG
jgi:chromosome segregation ATPase